MCSVLGCQIENALKDLPVSIWKSGAQRERNPLLEQEAESGSDTVRQGVCCGPEKWQQSCGILHSSHKDPQALHRPEPICTWAGDMAEPADLGTQRLAGKTELMGQES